MTAGAKGIATANVSWRGCLRVAPLEFSLTTSGPRHGSSGGSEIRVPSVVCLPRANSYAPLRTAMGQD